jgi:glyoxylase-like metal-dependent hydrolase (beta-lactamase superfamily II)/rhodanese-related sulfurtransferase
VDPARDASRYRAAADEAGLSIAFTAETHLHADFLTGSRELAAHGAQVLAPAAAALEWPHRGFGHSDEADLGGLTLRALATPGHTPEHIAWLLCDGKSPIALFSGGALLVGAVARTDLIAPDQTEPLARALWRALQETILTLADDLPVYPTHGAGSFCAASPSGERITTIGNERRTNALLASRDEDEFVARLLSGYGSYPPYFLRLRARNQAGPEVLGIPFPPLASLTAGDARRVVREGGVVVDARPVKSWAAGHIPGAVAIPLRAQFSTWLGWLVSDDRTIVFVVDPDQDAGELVRQARTIGYDRLVGTMIGVEPWRDAGLDLVTTELVAAAKLDRPVVDVRHAPEYAAGHLPDAVALELGQIESDSNELPTGRIAVMCAHGERAATAASLLERAGRRDVAVVVGGPLQWSQEHGTPLVQT